MDKRYDSITVRVYNAKRRADIVSAFRRLLQKKLGLAVFSAAIHSSEVLL